LEDQRAGEKAGFLTKT